MEKHLFDTRDLGSNPNLGKIWSWWVFDNTVQCIGISSSIYNYNYVHCTVASQVKFKTLFGIYPYGLRHIFLTQDTCIDFYFFIYIFKSSCLQHLFTIKFCVWTDNEIYRSTGKFNMVKLYLISVSLSLRRLHDQLYHQIDLPNSFRYDLCIYRLLFSKVKIHKFYILGFASTILKKN